LLNSSGIPAFFLKDLVVIFSVAVVAVAVAAVAWSFGVLYPSSSWVDPWAVRFGAVAVAVAVAFAVTEGALLDGAAVVVAAVGTRAELGPVERLEEAADDDGGEAGLAVACDVWVVVVVASPGCVAVPMAAPAPVPAVELTVRPVLVRMLLSF
jgi:hypothetical protein